MSTPADPEAVVSVLVANHRRFLDFLVKRTGSREDAEDVLQDAFVRAVEKGGALRRGESAVAWFYRLLRNTLIDRHRTHAARDRALESRAQEGGEEPEAELRGEVCRCVGALLPMLAPGYADLVRRVDLEGEPVNGVARALGITPNLAGVRLHRARKALLREVQRSCRTCAAHGCLDCSCGGPRRGGTCHEQHEE